ncbi:MAG: ClpXP protease specificity-enhancing factor [Betaproteobacteria bacterium]|jgi:stringent starvation protein B|nr:ClpXP protease specificity-enhancing factor [Betaproteobacteria bacterium]
MADTSPSTTTRPYLIRAIYEWCTDNGYTPYIVVAVNSAVRVPTEFVKNGEIVLNVSFDATSGLQLGNACIEFKGRFGGVARDIFVPVECVSAIYARENGQGMAFPVGDLAAAQAGSSGLSAKVVPDMDASSGTAPPPQEPPPPSRPKPTLTRVK